MRTWFLRIRQVIGQAALLVVVGSLFSLVAKRQRGQQEGSYLALLKREKPVPGVLMEMMKRYMRGYPTWDMANGSSFQVRTPGYYDLTRHTDECSPPHFSLWSESDPDLFSLHDGIHGHILGQASWWSESDLNELKWEQGAQVQREATAIVEQFWNPPLT